MIRIGRIAAMLTAGCTLALSAAEVRQSPATQSRTALILGHVVDGSNDRPMAGVIVTLGVTAATPTLAPTVPRPSTAPRPSAITDSNGRFVFNELPGGRYSFSISTASGVLIGGYGMRRPGGTTQLLELAEGQRAGDVTLRAWKYGSVGGTVVDQDGEPIVETRVTLLRVEFVAGHRRYRVGPTTMTDDRGMYRISRVEPGEYAAYLPYSQVTVPLDVQAAYDAASSKGQVARQEFERTYGLDSSSLNGSGLRIGDHLLIRASNSYGATGPIGPSFLSPPPDASGRVSVYQMTFYPGATALSEAATFTVESGQDRAGTDMQTRLVPAVQVSGRVMGIEGPAPMIGVRLVAQSAADADNEGGMETARTVTNASGDFTFVGVPSGSYVLRVARVPITTRPTTMTSVTVGDRTMYSVVDDSSLPPLPLPETPTESQSMPLSVGDEDIRNLTVQLQKGPRVSGRLAYNGSSPQLTADQLVRVTITLDPVDGRVFPGAAGKGQFEASGQFRTLGLLPGRYMLRVGGTLGSWSLDSVSIGDKSLPDQPIAIASTDVSGVVVTLTDRAGSISGSVRDARAGVDSTATVLLFPANRALWVDTTANPRRLRSIRVSPRGTWQIDSLPAGDYIVVAIDDRFAADWQRPQRLESLSRSGTHVTVGAAEKKTLELTTQVIR
jgi:hypothetical protein